MNTACTYRLTQHLVLLIVAILAAAPGMAQGGTLRIGSMTRENGNYVVPIVLSGAEDQVSALDFRLTYDPAVFQPVAAESGPAAAQANKVVTANSPAPGDYMVVMMGLNQTTVPQGEVAKIIMQQVSNPDGGQSELVIRDPTLATAGGVEIPSRGMSRTVDFADTQPEKPEPEDPAPTEETPEEEVPAEESAGDAINAGLEPDPGEVSENSAGRKSGASRFAQGPLPAAGSTATPRTAQQ
ncbi:MAG: hypothetical protein HYZ00_07150, partial [Candidatus Hydrogenedentes bacterium]|nr:hypothetical protein [Candidatus Hydrogenedentota bacterium]